MVVILECHPGGRDGGGILDLFGGGRIDGDDHFLEEHPGGGGGGSVIGVCGIGLLLGRREPGEVSSCPSSWLFWIMICWNKGR
jgi:hypothetical protein